MGLFSALLFIKPLVSAFQGAGQLSSSISVFGETTTRQHFLIWALIRRTSNSPCLSNDNLSATLVSNMSLGLESGIRFPNSSKRLFRSTQVGSAQKRCENTFRKCFVGESYTELSFTVN